MSASKQPKAEAAYPSYVEPYQEPEPIKEPKTVKETFKFKQGPGFSFKVDAEGNLNLTMEGITLDPLVEAPTLSEEFLVNLQDLGVRDIDAVIDAAVDAAYKEANRQLMLKKLLDNQVK